METILDKERMDAMKALADANMKVSEARASLAAIKGSESSYLAEREKKALEAVDRVLAGSAGLLKEARDNYSQAESIGKTVSEFAQFLAESQARFADTVGLFEERGRLWEVEVRAREETLAALRQGLEADKKRLENDKESLERAKKQLAADRKRVEDDRQTLERAITRLRSNKI